MLKKVVVLFVITVVLILPATYGSSASPLAAGCGLSGDLNEDGKVDINDIMLVANCWRSNEPGCSSYDFDEDDRITVVDIMRVAIHWGDKCPSSGPFGVQTFGELSNDLARTRVQEAGIVWARVDLYWKSIEPNEPVDGVHSYNWGGTDALINNTLAAGVNPMITIGHSPQWAVEDVLAAKGVYYDCGPIDYEHLEDFAAFVTALVERYDGDADYDGDGLDDGPAMPEVKYWEFWNEPDQIEGHDWLGGCWGGNRDNDGIPDSQEYVTMLSYAYPAVKAANPEAKVLLGALAWEDTPDWFNMNFLDEVLGYGGADYFDYTNFHQYDFQRDDWDGWENGQANNNDLPWRQGILGKIAAAREKVDKPVVVSEIGEERRKRGEEKQAMHLVHELVRGLSLWPNDLKVMAWFMMVDDYPTWNPPDGGGFGLISNPNDPDWPDPYHEFMAYWAYKILISELEDVEAFDYQLGPDPDPTNGTTGSKHVQAFRFVMGDGGKKLVLWTDDGNRLKYASDVHVQMAIGQAELGETWTGRLRLRVVDSTTPSYPPNEWIVEDGGDGDLDHVENNKVTLEITWDPLYVQLAP